MKRYKVKYSDEKTDKHKSTRSYDEEELIKVLIEEIKLLKRIIETNTGGQVITDSEESPLPSHKFRVYDRKKIAEV